MGDRPRIRRRGHATAEKGTTLVELLVYMILLVIVLAIVASIFISGKRVERDARSMADASNNAQLAAATIEGPLRNADIGSIEVGFGGDLLVVKSRAQDGEDNNDPASWTCRAWFYDEGTGSIHSRSSSVTGTPATANLTSGFSLAGWTVLIRNVAPNGSDPIFSRSPQLGATINFDVLTSRSDAPVNISSSVVPREQGPDIGTESCGNYG